MTTLIILILVQVAGIVLSFFISSVLYHRERKRTYISSRYKRKVFQNKECWPWLIEYFQAYPQSRLRLDFPEQYKVAMATKRYKELDVLLQRGSISERKYDKELNKILPLIDLKSDLEISPRDEEKEV
jgi:hypothetical protein